MRLIVLNSHQAHSRGDRDVSHAPWLYHMQGLSRIRRGLSLIDSTAHRSHRGMGPFDKRRKMGHTLSFARAENALWASMNVHGGRRSV